MVIPLAGVLRDPGHYGLIVSYIAPRDKYCTRLG